MSYTRKMLLGITVTALIAALYFSVRQPATVDRQSQELANIGQSRSDTHPLVSTLIKRPTTVPKRSEPRKLASAALQHSHATVTDSASRFYRAPDEWQGMLQAQGDTWPCAAGACTQARVCIEGICLPCTADAECEDGELCVLGACVVSEQVDCQTRADCSTPDSLCVLSGFTSMDPRGNRDMEATCLRPFGGVTDEHGPDNSVAALEGLARPSPVDNTVVAPQTRASELLRIARESRDAQRGP